MKHAMNGGSRDSITLSQLAQTLTLVAIPQDADAIEVQWSASDVSAFELGAAHAGANTLDNQVAFELHNGADNHYDRPTQWAAGVDLFLKLTNSTLRRFSSSSTSRKCFTDRARRSEAQTRTTSKRPRRASCII